MANNKITLNIAGFNLIINTTEDEEHVRKLNATLNEDLSQILKMNPSASVTNAALLCSLDYLDRYDKATHSANNLRTQIKDYLSDASNAKLMYEDEVKKNANLTKEIQTLRSHVTKLATEGANGSANEENLRKQLESSRGDAEILRRQLKEQLEQYRSLIDSSTQTIAAKDSEIQNLKSVIQQASEKIETLRNLPKPQHSDDEYDALKKKYDELEEKSIQLEIQVEDLTEANDQLLFRITENRSPSPSYTSETQQDPVFTDYEPDITSDFSQEPQPVEDSYSASQETVDYPSTQETFGFSDPSPSKSSFSLSSDEHEDSVPAQNLGVERGFKTFTQLMNEEKKERDYQQKQKSTNPSTEDDDDLPNLSWINDI